MSAQWAIEAYERLLEAQRAPLQAERAALRDEIDRSNANRRITRRYERVA